MLSPGGYCLAGGVLARRAVARGPAPDRPHGRQRPASWSTSRAASRSSSLRRRRTRTSASRPGRPTARSFHFATSAAPRRGGHRALRPRTSASGGTCSRRSGTSTAARTPPAARSWSTRTSTAPHACACWTARRSSCAASWSCRRTPSPQTFALSADGGRLALGLTAPRMPASVWLVDLDAGDLRRLGEPSLAEDELADAVSHRFSSWDGEPVQYWLLTPSTPPPWPLLVEIHGGPGGTARSHLDAGDPVLRVGRLRGRDAERARLHGLRQALRAPGRRPAAPRRGARRRRPARPPRRGRARRHEPDGALRRLVRRLHGARLARLPSGALGGGDRRRRHLQLRHLPGTHGRVAARVPRA